MIQMRVVGIWMLDASRVTGVGHKFPQIRRGMRISPLKLPDGIDQQAKSVCRFR